MKEGKKNATKVVEKKVEEEEEEEEEEREEEEEESSDWRFKRLVSVLMFYYVGK